MDTEGLIAYVVTKKIYANIAEDVKAGFDF